MTQDQLRENIDDNLERLKREYDICVNGYDRVSLKNLSAALRHWVDMKRETQAYMSTNLPNSLFQQYSPNRKTKRIYQDHLHIVCCFPGGITSFQKNRPDGRVSIANGPPFNIGTPYSIGNNMKIEWGNPVKISSKSFACVATELSGQDGDALLTGFDFKKVKFETWLNTEALSVRFINDNDEIESRSINREDIINRVGNSLGGNHPIGGYEKHNDNNNAIKYAMQVNVSGLPVPYYVLLKIAYDILRAFNYIPAV